MENKQNFTLSKLMKITRPYTNDPSVSYQILLGDFLSFFTKNEDFFVESTASSKIMNGIYGIPKEIRDFLRDVSNDEICSRALQFYQKHINRAKEDHFKIDLTDVINNSDISEFCKTEIIGEKDISKVFASTCLIALRADNKTDFRQKLWERGDNQINLISSDIISIGFNKKEVYGPRIVVIPVDQEFTMQLSNSQCVQLIARDSLHGKWIQRMNQKGYNSRRIKNQINYTSNENIGKIGLIKVGLTTFYLAALSKLDKNHVAHSSIENIIICLKSILTEYDINGQGEPIYIPLLGTGRSRTGIDVTKSISIIKQHLLKNTENIHGIINIVVYRKDVERLRESNDI